MSRLPEDLWPQIFIWPEDFNTYMLVSKKVREIAFTHIKLDAGRFEKRFSIHVKNSKVMQKLINCNVIDNQYVLETAKLGNIDVMKMLILKGYDVKFGNDCAIQRAAEKDT